MRDRLAAQVAPDDWPEGAAGYNWNPFAGVKVDGYFQEHHVDEQSQDPKIQEQNQKLWDACDEGDIEGVVDALKHGAEVNAGDPSEDWMWTALMHCCLIPSFPEPRTSSSLPSHGASASRSLSLSVLLSRSVTNPSMRLRPITPITPGSLDP
mmetsp:Transcript_4309/g.6831  ORF Transcript_4309/g.6831 Transcript_4309/m.6831 type:complete len:152 (-) Transcript_4309:1359-1814(-)